ncbi:MAG: hypothetical protein ACIAQZ_10180 [Sedimentisphaeraceae bacterium JB056]
MTKEEKKKINAERYLAQRGYSYDELNHEQKLIMNNFVRGKGMLLYSLIMILLSFLALAFTTYKGFEIVEKNTRFINAKDVIFYAVVAEDYERIIEPLQVRSIAEKVIETSLTNGVRLGTTFFLIAIMITAIIQQRDKRKTIEAFFPQKKCMPNENQEDS